MTEELERIDQQAAQLDLELAAPPEEEADEITLSDVFDMIPECMPNEADRELVSQLLLASDNLKVLINRRGITRAALVDLRQRLLEAKKHRAAAQQAGQTFNRLPALEVAEFL